MDYARLDQPRLAKEVFDMLLLEKIESRINQQTVSKSLKSKGSRYTSWYARACGVSYEWLENEIGDMVIQREDENSNWPFAFTEARYLRLSPQKKKFIERAVLTMIEEFEAEMGLLPPPKKTRKARL